MAQGRGETEVFICGGAAIYAAALAMADRLYLTRVHSTVDADVFFTEIPEPLLTLLQAMGEANEAFPDIDETDWVEKERWRHEADEKNQYPFTFSLLEKKR
jgi:dihydrofolate reductase